ncbi:glycoside hydrolase family 76 protein [Flavobacterium beibuense]|uniref:Glycosyl hydrolase family 76 n=1 Tax=Flavobacterium beibuense TaxID=657326 RepID=A0A444WGV0_9FLAO|nr:glycoside hydrolase family 76 protein [Flavobacterium beibuense]RYJ44982.1 Glycosyl hydrolase family 76 [Flavobacterium beibuense]
MKYLYITCFVFFASLQISCQENEDTGLISGGNTEPEETITYSEKAKQTFDLIQQYYKINSTGYYRENFPVQSGDRECSYLWSLDGLLSGVNQLVALGFDDPELNHSYVALEGYYDTQRTPSAYAAFPVQYSQDDRFYDDNAIIAIDLIENYEITNNTAYLNRAKEIAQFSLTGEDNLTGGGLYWSEQNRNNPESELCMKAVSSTAFSVTYLLRLYEHTDEEQYLQFAMRLYNWLNEYIQDPVDNLFWNDIRVSNNFVNTTKWTYNSGAMITNNVLLYEITGEEVYLDRARTIAASTYTHFTRTVNSKLFFPANDSWFNVCLFRGYLDLLQYDQTAQSYVNVFIQNADYAWSNARNEYDLFYEDWAGQNPGRDKWLLQQAGLVEMYGRIAILKGEQQ